VNPAIRQYLDEHASTYTPEALRRALLDAGYDPVEVDTALKEWQAGAADPASAKSDRRRFWRWAFALHVAVLAVISLLTIVIGNFAANYGLLIVLAVVLLIGLGISGLLGGGILRGGGLTTAIVVPAISALLIGGSCLAIGGSYLLRAPPRTGVMELHIEDPLTFDGSGAAQCEEFGGTSGFVVWAENLGTLDGSIVGVSLDAALAPAPGAVAPSQDPPVANLSITLSPTSETEQGIYYSVIFSTRLDLDASPDGRSGTLQFEGLEPAFGDRPPSEAPGLDAISGLVSWTCD
jgi:hypothetical protein